MKRFFITIAALSLSVMGWAQTAIGVKVNNPLFTINAFTNVQSNESYNVEYFGSLGLANLGFFANVPFNSHFAFQPELMYKQEAIPFQRQGEDLKDADRHYIRFNYIEVPLLLHIQGNNPFHGYGQVGIAPKFLAKATYSEKRSSSREDISSRFNSAVLAFHIGGGVMWDSPKWFFFLDGRLSANLTKVTADSYTPHLNFDDANSVYVAFSVGLGYKLGKR